MRTYKQIPEDAEYRELYDSYRRTVQNLNDLDFLYDTMMSDGQVFFKDDEVYGFVNGQPALRNRNIVIPRAYIDDFRITNFILFDRMTNDLITLDINCNLADYRDNKVHYLYVVLDHHGTYEVYDDMFQSDEYKILFARFLIGTDGDSRQFYVMLPFAGSADYIKGTQFYQVTDGLRVKVVNPNTKQLTVSRAKIRYSAINFDDRSSPDCITIDHEGNAVPIRYVYWDANDGIPRANWEGTAGYDLDFDTIMNYETGRTSRVPEGSYSIQKFYYDVYERCIVALYGNAAYNTREEAILSIDSVMNYPIPDGVEYLIPIACVVMENTDDPIDIGTNFRIVNLDYNEQEVLDSDTFTRQQAAEAISKSNQAIAAVSSISSMLLDHTGNLNNPHKVRMDQLYNSRGNQVTIDDSFAEAGLTVNGIINRALTRVEGDFYSKYGGQINGDVSVTRTLSVSGKTTLAATDINGNLKLAGNMTFDSSETRNIGSTSSRLNYLYSKYLNISDTSTLALVNTYSVKPRVNGSYYLGDSDLRWYYGYFNNVDISNSISAYSGSFSGSVSVSGSLTTNNISCNGTLTMGYEKKLSVNNGYLVIGSYSLRLGSEGSIPTQNGYGIW